MTKLKKTPFPCHGCGKCCRHVDQSPQTRGLDRGDGICLHFNEAGKQCMIYAHRPLVCRVEEYYDQHLSSQIAWEKFVEINLQICARLP